MMKEMILGVIGCGRIGQMHVENLIKCFPNVRIRLVCDTAPDLEWALKWKIPITDNLDQLLDCKEIEAVLIAAPSTYHIDLIKRVAAVGKHIFCEKPLAFDLDSIQEAVEAVETAGIKFQVGFNRRFDNDYKSIRDRVAAGVVGKPYVVKITNRGPVHPGLDFITNSGGMFMDKAVHDFDMAQYVTGQKVVEVFTHAGCLSNPEFAETGDVDTIMTSLRLSDGTLCNTDCARVTNYGYDQRLEIFGEKGMIKTRNIGETNITMNVPGVGLVADNPKWGFAERYFDAFVEQMKAFIAYLSNDDMKSPVDGYAAKSAVAVAVAARKSFQEKRSVKVSEVL
ncbi:MAG: Gfo/Idh/MocA family oxidoreductase [Lentisphaerae bacterium]|nr:Gfo/Idh/MocA family oxidoreductase [Lentisphaerota bacterium]MCP4103629.1 Gfo/Idh/MocA family oxidoreductase [Lentisphaerota bacterium]